MGPQARVILTSLTTDESVVPPFKGVESKFTEYFVHPMNKVYENTEFHKQKQLPDETVDSPYMALRSIVKHSNFNPATVCERLLRDRFVAGLLSFGLSH